VVKITRAPMVEVAEYIGNGSMMAKRRPELMRGDLYVPRGSVDLSRNRIRGLEISPTSPGRYGYIVPWLLVIEPL